MTTLRGMIFVCFAAGLGATMAASGCSSSSNPATPGTDAGPETGVVTADAGGDGPMGASIVTLQWAVGVVTQLPTAPSDGGVAEAGVSEAGVPEAGVVAEAGVLEAGLGEAGADAGEVDAAATRRRRSRGGRAIRSTARASPTSLRCPGCRSASIKTAPSLA